MTFQQAADNALSDAFKTFYEGSGCSYVEALAAWEKCTGIDRTDMFYVQSRAADYRKEQKPNRPG